jgi:DNA integrity scanning protein DisA with diadenylate cyclase activity
MSSKQDLRKEIRRDIEEAVKRIRKDIDHQIKDLTTAGRNWKDSTEKFVQDVTPKVSSTLDDTIERTSETFKKTMSAIDRQTRQQQVSLLRAYKSFLSTQVDVVEKRLKKLKR